MVSAFEGDSSLVTSGIVAAEQSIKAATSDRILCRAESLYCWTKDVIRRYCPIPEKLTGRPFTVSRVHELAAGCLSQLPNMAAFGRITLVIVRGIQR